MSAPVRAVCGGGGGVVGHVEATSTGPRYRKVIPVTREWLGGDGGPFADARRARRSGNRSGGPTRVIDFPIDEPAEDYLDEFPTFCGKHGEARIARNVLVDLWREYERTGIHQEHIACR